MILMFTEREDKQECHPLCQLLLPKVRQSVRSVCGVPGCPASVAPNKFLAASPSPFLSRARWPTATIDFTIITNQDRRRIGTKYEPSQCFDQPVQRGQPTVGGLGGPQRVLPRAQDHQWRLNT